MSTWYLKKQDASEYGPVELQVLCQWAADGRIDPTDEVSTDKESWRPAPDLPELKMVWLVELRDGRMYGPIHILAVYELFADGAASPEAKLIIRPKKPSAETAVEDDLRRLLAEKAEAAREAQETLAEQRREIAALKRDLMQGRARADYLGRKVNELAERTRVGERENVSLKRRLMLATAKEEYYRRKLYLLEQQLGVRPAAALSAGGGVGADRR
ncbi:MAG: DUF4339 domain-containing protein [Kiritimatiellae bacterium]|nr:DUF4339 domain-containing protein [Kiritimatiellia bacterium]